jgi:SLAP domain-containing protein
MQKLVFEDAWERSVSPIDRERIEKAFQHAIFTRDGHIQFTSLRQDLNYKNELLVMVLVHNLTEEKYSFQQKQVGYIHLDKILAKHTFTQPTLEIEAKTSMPWTFIFPVGSFDINGNYREGELKIID